MSVPSESEPLLSRKEAAEVLRAVGYRVAPATLAKLASVGGGPPFRKFGGAPVYGRRDLLAWANGRLTAPRRSTAERDAERTGEPQLAAAAPS